MIYFVYSTLDRVSVNAAAHIAREYGLEEASRDNPIHTKRKEIILYRTDRALLDPLPRLRDASVIYFISQHSSASGVSSFTTHAPGNIGEKAELGGKPKELSVAAPVEMLGALSRFMALDQGVEKTYEATHHGPLLEIPSLFVEFGGNDEARSSTRMAALLGEAAYSSACDVLDERIDYAKVVIGIGGTHYPSKFTRLAVEKRYAFSHIMPKHGADPEMLAQAVERSEIASESAVIDWKGINSYARSIIIGRLGQIGIDYERI